MMIRKDISNEEATKNQNIKNVKNSFQHQKQHKLTMYKEHAPEISELVPAGRKQHQAQSLDNQQQSDHQNTDAELKNGSGWFE